jgi:hypothetical protein
MEGRRHLGQCSHSVFHGAKHFENGSLLAEALSREFTHLGYYGLGLIRETQSSPAFPRYHNPPTD